MRRKFVTFVFCAFLLGAMVMFSGFTFISSAHAATLQHKSSTVSVHATRAYTCPPTISYGSNDNNGVYLVGLLQDQLNELYLNYSDPRWFANYPYNFNPPLVSDGDFGSLTRNAVKDYQYYNGLTVDGIVGPQTWGSLGEC